MEIQEIKSKLTLHEVLAHYNLHPDKNSRLNCPFHPDKTPSLQVYPKTNTCYCFSTNCPTHGKSIDVIDFILYKEGITKHEALLKATAMVGGEKKSTPDNLSKIAVLTKMFNYFRNGLNTSSVAKDYLESRCLHREKTEVGYNSGQFHHGKRKEENLIKSCLQYGLLLEKGTKSRTGNPAYTPFGKWSIVFPLRNENGQITGLYFRSTLSDKKQRHFYLKDRQGLYPKYSDPSTKKLILTESIIDAATLLEQNKIKSDYEVLALYGTNGLTAAHQKAIQELEHLEEIIFFLNGDEAGKAAVAKYAPMLKTAYPNVKITNVEVLKNEDVNSLLQSHDAEILSDLIKNRKAFTFFLSNEIPIENKKTSTQKEKPSPLQDLDTSNPHNLKYSGNAADYQIKGFKTEQLDSLKVSLQIIDKITRGDHRSKLDLYDYKQIKSVVNAAAERLALRNDLLEKDLSRLTFLLEEYREKQQSQKQNTSLKIEVPQATASQCLDFMKQKNLIERYNGLIEKAGITGEQSNRILLFIIATSYKMPDTLHALIQGSSGSGKTRLLKIVSEMMPPEDIKRYTRVTDNSFYNQDEYFFVHKLICFEDLDGLKEDAQLAVRELQSNEILITSTSIKDANGSIRGGERIVRGPIASLSCTTKGELYEDNISRSFLVAVDESREQTLNIIHYQNQMAGGRIDKTAQQKTIHFVQNCIRLLKPYEVVNPFADKIKLPEEAHKIRRLNELYQSFVKQTTLLNQYQRKQDKQGRLITEKEDLQSACDILFESIVLKVDELDGSLRQFFEKLKSFVEKKGKDYEFNRFEVRKATGVSKTQQHYYIQKLVEMEYLRQYGFANRGYRYKISHWDNMAMMRAKIKDHLSLQLQQIN